MLILALLVAQAAAPVSKIPDMKRGAGIPSLLESGMPEVPPQLRARIEQYQNSRSANAVDGPADGSRLLIATRFASTNQLHLVEQPMGTRTQLTFGNEPVNSARFVPGDPRALLYLQDVGGGEFHQVFRLDRRTGRSELLTDGKSRHEGLIVSADGTRFAYSGTGRNGPPRRGAPPRSLGRSSGTWRASPSRPTARTWPLPPTRTGGRACTSSTCAAGAPSRSTCRGASSPRSGFPTSAATCCSLERRRPARPTTCGVTRS